MKSFGIGCLHFAINEKLKKNITIKEYVDEIERALSKLATVSEISSSYDESEKESIIDISENTKMENGECCYPQVSLFRLNFKLYVPKRIQAMLLGRPEEYVHTGAEHFVVNMNHDWHGPVSFVQCIDADIESSPSTAIQVVREYLEQEFSSMDTFLEFDCIGPSPFHADFFLVNDDDAAIEQPVRFALDHIKIPGYDQLIFTYSEEMYDTEEDALTDLYQSLSQEAAYFYSLKVVRSKQIHSWIDIQNGMHELLAYESEGVKKSLQEKIFRRSKIFKDVFRKIGIFKGDIIFDKSIIDQQYSDMYKSEKYDVYLKYFVDKVIDCWQVYPVTETAELLMYFDQKNTKTFELSVAFIAAIVGGAVGAVITVVFSS